MRQHSRVVLLPVLAGGVFLAAGAGADHHESKSDKAQTTEEDVMVVEVGKAAPDFTLSDTEGNEYTLSEILDGETVVVLEWFNPDCPFVKKHHQKTTSMADTYSMAKEEGIVWLAINSGAPGKQGNGTERNQKAVQEYKIAYPVLLDESGEVGKAYGAKTTPHMFIINADGVVVYEGAIDDKPDTQNLGDTNYVKHALGQMDAGEAVSPAETKPYGCSVKYGS
jgi:peroxiredoxin